MGEEGIELKESMGAGMDDDDLMGAIGIDLGDSEGEAEPEEEPGYDTPVGQAGSGQTPADILRDMDPQAIATRVAAEVRDMVVKRLEYLVTAAVEEAVIREIQKLKKAAAER